MPPQLELQMATSEADVPGEEEFQSWADTCFPDLDATILVRVVDQEESAQLNQQYRQKQGPTNVLSFPFEVPEGVDNDHLGDLVMCAPVIKTEALDQAKRIDDHWGHMLVHGVLHLQGYDHLTDSEAETMESLDIELLSRLAIADPYG